MTLKCVSVLIDENRILDSLPHKMKTDVAINVHMKTLNKVQLFKDCDKALLRELVLKLRPILYLPGDYICRKVSGEFTTIARIGADRGDYGVTFVSVKIKLWKSGVRTFIDLTFTGTFLKRLL